MLYDIMRFLQHRMGPIEKNVIGKLIVQSEKLIDKTAPPSLTVFTQGFQWKEHEMNAVVSRTDVDSHREQCSTRLKKLGISTQVKLCKAAHRLQGKEMMSGVLIYQAVLDFLAPPDDPPRTVSWEELEAEAATG